MFPVWYSYFGLIIFIHQEALQDVGRFSKRFSAVCRSISVPYAYQCCAFIGCDATTRSSAELDVKKSTGGNTAESFPFKNMTCQLLIVSVVYKPLTVFFIYMLV